MKKFALCLNPVLAALLLGACSTNPKMPDKAWSVEPVQTVRHGHPSAAGYYALGRYKEGQGAADEAVAAYRKALEAEPGKVAAWSALGALQALRGRFDDGVAALERAVNLAPAASHLHNNLGYALLLAGRDEAAASALRRAVELDGGNRRAWANLATVYRRLGDPDRADVAEARWRGNTLPLPKPSAPPAPGGPILLAAASATVAPVMHTEMPAQVALPALSALAPAAAEGQPPAAAQRTSSGRVTVRTAQPVGAPDSMVVKVAENVYTLRNGPPAAAEVAEAAVIIAAVAPPAVVAEGAADGAAPRAEAASPRAAAATPAARAVRYEIANGHGSNGLARRLATLLREQGQAWPRLTNQRPFDVPASFVEYRDGYREAAAAFAAALPFKPLIAAAASAQLAVDVRLVLGRELTTSDACAVLGLCTRLAAAAMPADTRLAAKAGAHTDD